MVSTLAYRLLLLICLISLSAVPAPAQSWTALNTSGGPSVSDGSSVVYDHASNRLIFFGGVQGAPCCTSFNDVWILTNANGFGGASIWIKLTPAAPNGLPPARSFQSAIYDSANNVMTIFGGGVAGTCGYFCTIYNDVWVLSNANGLGGTPTWTQLFPSGTAPAPREGHTAVYDSTNNQMIVFGGGNNGIMNVPNDLWALTNANGLGGTPAWIQLNETGQVPSPVERFATAYDLANNRMTIFGGCCYWNNNTWLLTNANGLSGTPTWTQLSPSGTLPQIREVHAYGYDPALDMLTLFGLGGAGISYNDTWTLSFANDIGGTPTWTNIIPNNQPGSPALPFLAADPGVYDPFSARLMLEKTQDNGQGVDVVVPWVLAASNLGQPNHTLTVSSTNPSSGVAISVTPLDNNGLSDGSTQFTRTYSSGAQVTLTAPAIAGGNTFSGWAGCDSTSGPACAITMSADRTATANFVTPASPPPTITSTSPSQAIQGGQLSLFLINGANFQNKAVVSFSGGQDITITAMSTTPAQIVLNLSISATAALGSDSVTVTNPDGQSATLGAALTVLAVPAIPQGLYAVVGSQTVYLWWAGTQTAPQGYNVYVNGAKANLSGLVQGTFFPVNGLQNGQRYQFSVTAVGGGGESSPATISAMPNTFGAQAHPPHPILFLHGINSNATAWETTADFLTGTLGWTCGGTFAYASTDDPNTMSPHAATQSEGLPSPCLSVANLSADYFTTDFGNNLANYPDNRGISHQGDEVGGFIRMLQGRGPLSIVAWSMGGLAARSYMQVTDPTDAPMQISDLVTLGTPHLGVHRNSLLSPPAFLIASLPLVFGLDATKVLSSQGVFDMDGGCVADGLSNDLSNMSEFLQSLDNSPTFGLPDKVRYVAVSGSFPISYPNSCPELLPLLIQTDIVVPSASSTLSGIAPAPLNWSFLQSAANHFGLPSDVSSILCALDQNCLELQVMSPVDIQVTAPNGMTLSNNFTSMPGADYTAVVDASGHETATILIPFPQGGAYTIAVTPKPGAQPTDTYTITITQDGATMTIADHVQVQNIPSGGYHSHVNSRPFANAGEDQTVECAGHRGTPATLNGSASRDQDGDPLSFVWTDSQGNVVGASAIVTVMAHMGTQTYTLTVTDSAGLSSTAQTHVTVRDTTPPNLQVTLTPNVLWPPNNKLVPVTANIQATDICDPSPTVTLVSITSNDPDDDDAEDIQGAVFGTDDRTFLLRARKADRGKERIYTITYQAIDHSGNTSTATAEARVPKDRDDDHNK